MHLSTLNVYVQSIFDVLDRFALDLHFRVVTISMRTTWIMPNELLFRFSAFVGLIDGFYNILYISV